MTLVVDLDVWLRQSNEECTHQGKHCDGPTPMPTFVDGKAHAKEKMLHANFGQAEASFKEAAWSDSPQGSPDCQIKYRLLQL